MRVQGPWKQKGWRTEPAPLWDTPQNSEQVLMSKTGQKIRKKIFLPDDGLEKGSSFLNALRAPHALHHSEGRRHNIVVGKEKENKTLYPWGKDSRTMTKQFPYLPQTQNLRRHQKSSVIKTNILAMQYSKKQKRKFKQKKLVLKFLSFCCRIWCSLAWPSYHYFKISYFLHLGHKINSNKFLKIHIIQGMLMMTELN